MIIYYWKKFNDTRSILFDLYPGVLNKVFYGEAPPMYTIFDGKGTPIAGIHIPSTDKRYSFHELFIEFCIPFNCCKWTVYKIWINHKTRMFFSTISQPKKFICEPFFFFFLLIEMTDFATLSYTSINKWNPDTFMYLKPEIGTPFGRSLPLQAIIGSTPGDLYDSVLPAHPADQIVFSTSSTCNLPGRECVLFPMKNFSPSDVVLNERFRVKKPDPGRISAYALRITRGAARIQGFICKHWSGAQFPF